MPTYATYAHRLLIPNLILLTLCSSMVRLLVSAHHPTKAPPPLKPDPPSSCCLSNLILSLPVCQLSLVRHHQLSRTQSHLFLDLHLPSAPLSNEHGCYELRLTPEQWPGSSGISSQGTQVTARKSPAHHIETYLLIRKTASPEDPCH